MKSITPNLSAMEERAWYNKYMAPRDSAGGIIVNTEGKIVLVEQHGNSWSFPKGGIEAGETELDAAKREIFEETGITDILLIEKLGSYERYSIGPHGRGETMEWGLRKRTIFLFTTKTYEVDMSSIDTEVTKVRCFTIDEALEYLTHPKDVAFLELVREKVQSTIV